NEAFACQALSVIRQCNLPPDRVNVNGGAIALGHPLGATGAKLTVSILHELKRRKGRYGLVTMCVGGGMGGAGIFHMSNSQKKSAHGHSILIPPFGTSSSTLIQHSLVAQVKGVPEFPCICWVRMFTPMQC